MLSKIHLQDKIVCIFFVIKKLKINLVKEFKKKSRNCVSKQEINKFDIKSLIFGLLKF